MRSETTRTAAAGLTLPRVFDTWFAAQGWTPRPHQLAMLEAARAGESVLLIAPTGGGKTLAGFLPSLVDLAATRAPGLHTLYVSPLKALATDIARNLTAPVQEMGLPVTIETRTGDTPANRRARQRADAAAYPADHAGKPRRAAVAARCAADVRRPAHAGDGRGARAGRRPSAATSWRSGVARLGSRWRRALRRVGLSATVAHPGRDPGLCRRRHA